MHDAVDDPVRRGQNVNRHGAAWLLSLALALSFGSARGQVGESQQATAGRPDATRLHLSTPPLAMPGFGRGVSLRVLLPPDYATTTRRYPVLYLFDGQNLFDASSAYAGEWGIDEAMDAEFARSGFAAIVVGIDHGGARRINELSAWPNMGFGAGEFDWVLADLVSRLKPYVDRSYRTRVDPAHTLIGGSSLGGLAANYAIHRRPDVFGRALVFSPSLWISEQAIFHARNVALPSDARVYVFMGSNEGSEPEEGVEAAQRLLAAIGSHAGAGGQAILHIEPGAEHNEAAWRAAFPRALRWVFDLEP